MTKNERSDKELKLTAALYASRDWIINYLKDNGRLPDNINLPGGWIGMNHIIKDRGTDITPDADEQLVYDALLREGHSGPVILIDEEEKRQEAKNKKSS